MNKPSDAGLETRGVAPHHEPWGAGDIAEPYEGSLTEGIEEYEEEEAEPLVDAEPYQKLVRYFREKDAEHAGYRKIVDERYWPKKYGSGEDDGVNVQGALEPSLIYQVMHNSEARFLGAHPQFLLRGFTPLIDKEKVPTLERGLNNEWTHDRATVSQIAEAYREAFKHGWALAITTYDAEFEEKALAMARRKNRIRERTAENPMEGAIGEEIMNQAVAEASLAPTPTTKPTFEMSSLVRTDSINTRLVRYGMIDPDCTGIDDAQWVGRTMYVRMDALRHDRRFNPEVVEMVQPCRRTQEEGGGQQAPYEVAEIHELFCQEFDGQGRARWKRVTFAEGCKYALESRWSPMWIGQPYSMLTWNTDGNSPFGMPQPLVFEDMYRALTGLMTKIMEGHVKNNQHTTFFRKDVIAEQLLKAMAQGSPPRFVGVDLPDLSQRLGDLFYDPQRPSESPESLNTYALLKAEMERGLGMGANQQLQAMKSDTSAREVAEVAQNAAMAMSHVERAIETFVLSIARKRLGHMGQFYGKERMLRIAGYEAAAAWPEVGTPFTEGDVQAGMGLHIHKGSMRPRNDASDFQNALAYAQIVGANPYMSMNTNWIQLMRNLARSIAGVSGESFMVTTDEEAFQQMVAQFQAAQALQGGGVGGGGQSQSRGVGSQPRQAGAA
jgi:hypothetical protein